MKRISASLLIMLLLVSTCTAAYAGKRAADLIMPARVDVTKTDMQEDPDINKKKK